MYFVPHSVRKVSGERDGFSVVGFSSEPVRICSLHLHFNRVLGKAMAEGGSIINPHYLTLMQLFIIIC